MATSTNIDSGFMGCVSNETQNTSPYSQEQLPCGGRACARCDKCRDWYWIVDPGFFSNGKIYIKRADATCSGCYGGSYDGRYDCDGCFGGGSYYHIFFGCCCIGRHCECGDNQS